MSAVLSEDPYNPLAAAEDAVNAGDFHAAISHYEGMVEPGGEMLAGIIHNLIPLYLKIRRPSMALRAAQALVFFSPRSTDAWMALASVRERFADWEGALQALHQVLDLDPMHEGAHQSRLFLMSGHSPQEEVRAAHEGWYDSLPALTFAYNRREIGPDPNRKLRIGYVSGDFRRHVMDRVIGPLLQFHNREQVEVYCYDTVNRPDAMTEHFRTNLVQWSIWKDKSDSECAKEVVRDQIDILVDMSGLTFGQRMGVFRMRPAPIQVTATGYLPTTGAKCFDWKLCDATAGLQQEYTEPLWRLPNALAMSPLPGAPAITDSPFKRNGYITFGCVNSYAKVTREAIDAWTEILQRVDTSRLVMVVAGCSEQETAISVLRRFGPVQDRVMLTEWATGERFPIVFNDIDIALNTHPYGGCATSFDTLWQGAPIICMKGDRTVGRYAAHFMNALGLQQFVANDWGGYIRAAVLAAKSPKTLQSLRYSLRPAIQSLPMFNTQLWVRNAEGAYRDMWRRYCAS